MYRTLFELCLNLAVTTALMSTSQATPLDRRSGVFSAVTLLQATRDVSASEIAGAPGADDALLLNFLITRQSGASGPFTVKELQDFRVRGESYSRLSRAGTRGIFSAETILYDARSFKQTAPADLLAVFPSGFGEDAVVMSTLFSGAKLISAAPAEVMIEVGWGDKTEKFNFAFRIPK